MDKLSSKTAFVMLMEFPRLLVVVVFGSAIIAICLYRSSWSGTDHQTISFLCLYNSLAADGSWTDLCAKSYFRSPLLQIPSFVSPYRRRSPMYFCEWNAAYKNSWYFDHKHRQPQRQCGFNKNHREKRWRSLQGLYFYDRVCYQRWSIWKCIPCWKRSYKYDDENMGSKRMFIHTEYQGRGIGSRLVLAGVQVGWAAGKKG